MGNGVVDVEQVERFGFENLSIFCARPSVRMVEERIGNHFTSWKWMRRIVRIHADRRGVADEMMSWPRAASSCEFGGTTPEPP